MSNTHETLTPSELAALLSGREFMNTNAIPRLDIPRITMADGPHGLRKQNGIADNGVSDSEPSTAFPTAATTAASWNTENLYKMGKAIAEEALYYGVNVVLGPGVNIKRNPLCGRNFEYFSEDPLLSGKMGAAEIMGLQDTGVSACVKHFALNNSENYRFIGDSLADRRAMEEIYLRSFEIAIKDGKPHCVMSAYNKLLGEFCNENEWLLRDTLRTRWGYDGVVMTDWGGMHDRIKSQKATLDLEMPGDCKYTRGVLYSGLLSDDEELSYQASNSARRIIALSDYHKDKKPASDPKFEEHAALAAEIAADSAVLMKNDGTLPLNKSESFVVIGELFEQMRYQGAGSSMINSTKVISPRNAFDKIGIKYDYAKGYDESDFLPREELIDSAAALAKNAEKILLFIGLTDYAESEGADRYTMRLPINQVMLIERLAALEKPIIAVLFGGSPFVIPCLDKMSAVLNMYLPGQSGGIATADILFGNISPSGKLAESWPKSYKSVPFYDKYSKTPIELYKESVFVGYRYYLSKPSLVEFPFGHGLSYASFRYSNSSLSYDGDKYRIEFDVTNVSSTFGAEVAQVYIKPPESRLFAPKYELCGFKKVYLTPSETEHVSIEILRSDIGYFNTNLERRVAIPGEYHFLIGESSTSILLDEVFILDGDDIAIPYSDRILDIYSSFDSIALTDQTFESMLSVKIPTLPPTKPLTMESRFRDFHLSFFGRLIRKLVMYFLSDRRLKRARKMPESPMRDNKIKGALFVKKILDTNSINTLVMCSSGTLPYNVAEGLVYIANGRFFTGIFKMLRTYRAPKLPEKKRNHK